MAQKVKFFITRGPTIDSSVMPWHSWKWESSELLGDKKSPNAYTATRSAQSCRPGIVTVTTRNSGVWSTTSSSDYAEEWGYSWPKPSFRAPDGPLSSDASNKAKAKLFKEMKDGNWNAALFIGESKESWHTIRSAATRLYQAQRALRRGNLKLALTSLGVTRHRYENGVYPTRKTVQANASGYWLEAQLGWKPLLQDMHDGAKAIATILVDPLRPPLVKCIGRGTSSSLVSSTQKDVDANHSLKTTTTTNLVRGEIGVYFRQSSKGIKVASSLGLTNPMSLIWEAIPMSFVIDYVLGIGDYLENLTAFHGFDFHSGWITTSDTVRSSYVCLGGPPVNKYTLFGYWVLTGTVNKSGYTYRYESKSIARSVLTSFPSPKVPTFDYAFKKDRFVRQTLNVLSLFAQFKSK